MKRCPKFMLKALALALALVVLAAGAGNSALAVETPVIFPDPNLEAAVRQAINKPQGAIYPADLKLLTQLTAQERGIVNLSGLDTVPA